jgi:hypothetical protein
MKPPKYKTPYDEDSDPRKYSPITNEEYYGKMFASYGHLTDEQIEEEIKVARDGIEEIKNDLPPRGPSGRGDAYFDQQWKKLRRLEWIIKALETVRDKRDPSIQI